MPTADAAPAPVLAGQPLTPERVARTAPLVRAMAEAAQRLHALALTEAPSGPDARG